MKRGDTEGAIDAGRRMLEQAVDAGIKRAQGVNVKPTLRRYSWSRLHVDLLDDFRWALVAKRAVAPLPIVEALLIRLENHANRSRPRGFVGDFSAEAAAARWNVDAEMIGRIYAELERPDIGWLDQDQIVTFWDRNPDVVDDTAAERQQRARDRKKAMRQLAKLYSQGVIAAEVRTTRELAIKDSREPLQLMDRWAGLSTEPSRRDSVTVTTRPDQNIKTESGEKEESGLAREGVALAVPVTELATFGQADAWLKSKGELLVCRRMMAMRHRACQLIERWSAGVDGDLVALGGFILAADRDAKADPKRFQELIEDQIARRAQHQLGPVLPLMVPVDGNKDIHRHAVTPVTVDISENEHSPPGTQKRSAS